MEDIVAAAPVDLIGFSAGARVAISIAAQRPDLVRKLVLMGPNDAFLIPLDPTPIIDAIQSDEPPARASHAVLRRLVRAPGNSEQGLMTFLRHATEHVTPEFLALITSPTLVITGSEDANGDAGALRACLPGATHCQIDGCDHFRLPSDPRTMEAALAFLST
jgi:pimeloyl-ACP methyl ester carboxylesterase